MGVEFERTYTISQVYLVYFEKKIINKLKFQKLLKLPETEAGQLGAPHI